MSDSKEEIIDIYFKVITGQELSATEKEILRTWLSYDANNAELHKAMTNDEFVNNEFREYFDLQKIVDAKKSEGKTSGRSVPLTISYRIKSNWKFIAAASLILMIGGYFIFSAEQKAASQRQVSYSPMDNRTSRNDTEVVYPAVQRASLSIASNNIGLSENSTLELAPSGYIVINGVPQKGISNNKNGSIYSLTTPAGGTYNLTLSDGTRIWLNAATVLKFPAAFDKQQRRVQVKGEAFFEIATIPNQPFIIETDQGAVKVLGTTFNLKAYEKEEMITSLLTGSVQISSSNDTQNPVLIKPGQQAKVTSTKILIDKVTNNPAAWKDKIFSFYKTTIEDVLLEVSRWYDVKVDFKSGVSSNAVLVGEFDRGINLNKLLPHLSELSGLNLELVGKTIIVKNK